MAWISLPKTVMPASFPHSYAVSLAWDGDSKNQGGLRAVAPEGILTGPPPQFDGTDEVWSPEDLLLAALASCTMTTFLAIARNKKLEVGSYSTDGEAVLDKTKAGLGFTEIILRVDIEVAAGDEEKAERVLAAAHKYCIVANALKPEVRIESTIRAK